MTFNAAAVAMCLDNIGAVGRSKKADQTRVNKGSNSHMLKT
jgi:hypothetical protein